MKFKEIVRAVNVSTTLVAWIIFVIVGIIFVIDGYLALRYGPKGTISDLLINWSSQYPIIPFLFGFFMGHLFFSNTNVT